MPRAKKLGVFSGLGVLAIVCMFLYSPNLYGQLAGAQLSGSVTDPSGAAIPGAQVEIKNTANGSVRAVTTDSSGFYSAPNLSPGNYDVTVSAKGFKTTVRTGIDLTVGSEQSLNVPLEVGQVTQRVTVSGAPPSVQLTSPTMSGYVSQATVRQLPLNGRDWTALATLQPGVIAGRAQASTASTANRGNRGFGNQLSDDGHRPNENTYQIDGIVINDYSNGAPGSVEGVNLGVDAIREFSVMTSNFDASAGRTSGAVINAVTKSGTNQFHGDAYIFFRDKIFDATPYFGSASNKPKFRRNQFGASAGGPIQKNKTFIFGDFEAIRQSLGEALKGVTLSDAARAGNLSTGTVTVNPLVQPFLALWPSPANNPVHGTFSAIPGGNGDTENFFTSGQQTVNENYFTVRADHTFSSSDNIAGTYFYDRAPQTNPAAFGNYNSSVFTKRQMFGITENHIFGPSLLNTFRIGFSRVVGLVGQPGVAFNPVAADTSLGSLPDHTAAILAVGGLSTLGGLGSDSQFRHHWNSYQLYDDAFWTHGTQSISFGFAFERMEYNCFSLNRQNGSWVFGSIADFLTNVPTTVLQLDLVPPTEVGVRQSRFGLYIQDSWRVRPNFTWDMGFRYEPLSRPTEAHNEYGLLSNFFTGTIPTTINPGAFYQGNPTLKDFDPRVGFAWDPFSTGKTSVRAAFGIFDVLPLPYLYTIGSSLTYPFAVTGSATATGTPALTPGSFPTGAYNIITSLPLAEQQTTYAARYIQQYPQRSYAMNWNLNIQRQFMSNWTAMVGYVGSHTLHEEVTYDDANMVVPTAINGRLFWPCDSSIPDTATGSPCTAGLGIRANPNVGFIRPQIWDGASTYEGLLGELRSKPSHGFQFQASYTYGKCIDLGSGAQLGDPFLNSITSLIVFSHQARRGVCDFNITQNFVANWLYQLPNPKFSSAMASRLVGGWELGGVLTASTGVPFTMILSGDPLGQNSTDPVDFVNRIPGCKNLYTGQVSGYLNLNCLSVPMAPAGASGICDQFPGASGTGIPGSCRNVFGNSGRNAFVGPGLVDLDFSVIKDNYIPAISETFNIQLRFEFFNILNHPNFQSPQAFDTNFAFNGAGTPIPGAGSIDATTTDNREIQLAAKIVW